MKTADLHNDVHASLLEAARKEGRTTTNLASELLRNTIPAFVESAVPTSNVPTSLEDVAMGTGISRQELESVTFQAGVKALNSYYFNYGEISVPLQMAVIPKDSLPIFLPRNLVLMMREICEASGVTGGLDGYLSNFGASMALDSFKETGERPDGLIGDICDGYGMVDPGTVLDAMRDAIQQWEPDGQGGVRRKAGAA